MWERGVNDRVSPARPRPEMLTVFSRVFCPLTCFGEIPIFPKSFAHFKVGTSVIVVVRVLYRFLTPASHQIHDLQIFSLIPWWFFTVDNSLLSTKVFHFEAQPTFFLLLPGLLVSCKKPSPLLRP